MSDAHLLSYAIALRKNKKYDQSRMRLFSLLKSSKDKGPLYLHIAWSYDNQGREEQALKYYQQALGETLGVEEEFEAIFGLACTARCLGRQAEAIGYFELLLQRYPTHNEVVPFYALCAMELQETSLANRLLMELVISHPPTEAIVAYQATLANYWQELHVATKQSEANNSSQP